MATFNFAQIPLIGALFTRGQNLLASGTQHIKEQIAVFHLTPQNIQNFRARAAQLGTLPTVTMNTDDAATLLDIKNKTNMLSSQYDTVNQQVDAALNAANALASGSVSLNAAASVATAASGINDVLSASRVIDNKLAGLEQRWLTPQQRVNIRTLGVAPVAGSVINTKTLVWGAVIVGGIWAVTRRRRS